LVELAGLPDPATLDQALNGTSLGPLFKDPLHGKVKEAAFSQFAKISTFDVDPKFTRNMTNIMGYSVRVSEWRYTAWFEFDPVRLVPKTEPEHILGRELYDHRGDTGMWLDYPGENLNLVQRDEHAELVKDLHQRVLGYIRLKPVTL